MAPANKAFGRFWTTVFLQVFIGFHEFLQVFDCFSRVVAKLLHQKPGFVNQNFFFLQKLVQNQVLIPRPAFFRDLVDTGYRYYIYTYIHIFNIYIEFRCFGGICCGGILTVRKTKVWWPRHNREANLIKQFLNIFIHIYQHNTDWKVEFW